MRYRYKIPVIALLVACMGVLGSMPAHSSTVQKRNIGHLIALGEDILFGTVVEVRDGIDPKGVPYTEVTVQVRDTAKGSITGSYTFRQFGLLAPRDMGNGLVNLNVTPDGWPTYSQGEDVALFLYKPAAWTGLRTTVGLSQGKFTIKDGQVTNIIDNEGLFTGVQVDKTKLNEKEMKMLSMRKGKVNEETFSSFVHKAVQERWFDQLGE